MLSCLLTQLLQRFLELLDLLGQLRKVLVNRITATGAYMHHRFLRASFKLNNVSNFVRLLCLKAQNVAKLFNFTSGVRVRVWASRAEDKSRGSLVGLKI